MQNDQIKNMENTSSDFTFKTKRIGKIRASIEITKASWNLFKKDKEIIFFPITLLACFILIAALIGAFFYVVFFGGNLNNLESIESKLTDISYSVEIASIFIIYFLNFFLTIFFEIGIITIIHGRLNNQDLTFSDGIKNSFSKIGRIAQWSLLSATVGILLKLISDRSRLAGKIITSFLGATWGILTFFIAPILATEDMPIKDSLKKSAIVMKKVWGETLIINVGVGLFLFCYF